MSTPHLRPGFDFTDPDLYAVRVPTEEFAEVRRAAPVVERATRWSRRIRRRPRGQIEAGRY